MNSSNEHHFTLRGCPVTFRPSQFFGALHAGERGNCSFSHSGYRSLSGFTLYARSGVPVTELITPNFIESLAAQHDRNAQEVLREVTKHSLVPITNGNTFNGYTSRALRALEYGLFATDEMRSQLWQAAHTLYSTALDSRVTEYPMGRRDELPTYIAEMTRQFETLRQLMSGDMSKDKIDPHTLCCIGSTYFDLPPKPNGEPIIPIPAMQLALF